MARLIKPEDIPETLWHPGSKCLRLAPSLLTAWGYLLQYAGLEEKALQPVPNGEIGGLSKEETDDHSGMALQWFFGASSTELA